MKTLTQKGICTPMFIAILVVYYRRPFCVAWGQLPLGKASTHTGPTPMDRFSLEESYPSLAN